MKKTRVEKLTLLGCKRGDILTEDNKPFCVLLEPFTIVYEYDEKGLRQSFLYKCVSNVYYFKGEKIVEFTLAAGYYFNDVFYNALEQLEEFYFVS